VAHNDDIDKIRYESTLERIRRVKFIDTEFSRRYVLETPMEMIWPNGDPVPRDRETLVEFISQEQYESFKDELS
jgi:hypothetical protein